MTDSFGFSARTVKSYLAGESPVPVAVQIACNAMRENRAYLVRPLPPARRRAPGEKTRRRIILLRIANS